MNETERKTPEFVFGLTKLCLEFMVSKTFTDGPTINTHSGPVIRKIKEILLGYEDLLKISVMHDSPEVTLSLKVAILQAVEAVWKNSGKSCGVPFHIT